MRRACPPLLHRRFATGPAQPVPTVPRLSRHSGSAGVSGFLTSGVAEPLVTGSGPVSTPSPPGGSIVSPGVAASISAAVGAFAGSISSTRGDSRGPHATTPMNSPPERISAEANLFVFPGSRIPRCGAKLAPTEGLYCPAEAVSGARRAPTSTRGRDAPAHDTLPRSSRSWTGRGSRRPCRSSLVPRRRHRPPGG